MSTQIWSEKTREENVTNCLKWQQNGLIIFGTQRKKKEKEGGIYGSEIKIKLFQIVWNGKKISKQLFLNFGDKKWGQKYKILFQKAWNRGGVRLKIFLEKKY